MRTDRETFKVRLAALLVAVVWALSATFSNAQSVDTVHHSTAIDPEAIILIEDMIEYAQWDIQEGQMDAFRGRLLIANLEDLKSKLED